MSGTTIGTPMIDVRSGLRLRSWLRIATIAEDDHAERARS